MTKLFKIIFTTALTFMLFQLMLLPFNHKEAAALVVTVMGLVFNFLTVIGSGIVLKKLNDRNKKSK